MTTIATEGAHPLIARQGNHFRKILAVWGLLAGIGTPLVYFVLGPHLAPGTQTTSAASQQFDLTVLLTLSTPVVLAVYVWFGYALIFFRQPKGVPLENGVWIERDSVAIQMTWLFTTGALVLSLFTFGTYELIAPAGAGGAEGPNPIWTPAGARTAATWSPTSGANHTELQVQVIAQQWKFTYRWPQFGGMETTGLDLPVNTPIQFNVTSLDVIHSFWPYRLGVKADANPGVNDVAYTTATQLGPFTVRCDELCGLWHGAMVDKGAVVSQATFYSWVTSRESANAALTKELPKYSLTYSPSVGGAGGSYYSGNDLPKPPSEK